jgi:hypothetical protein
MALRHEFFVHGLDESTVLPKSAIAAHEHRRCGMEAGVIAAIPCQPRAAAARGGFRIGEAFLRQQELLPHEPSAGLGLGHGVACAASGMTMPSASISLRIGAAW